jgi:microcystin-dependent protein
LTGAVAGDFLQYDGTKFIAANIDLGSLTVGNYVATIAGTASEIDVSGSGVEGAAITLSLPATINADTTGSAARWTNSRTITLGGDLSGSVSIDGSANATLTATVAANSVALGTDTTGDYVSTITAGTGISISSGSGTGEGSTPTLAIGQSVATSATPSFSTITSTVTTGTAPLTVASETLVTNLNADRLDGEHGSWYSPSGLISPYAGLTAPPGWLFCNGQSVSRTTYATLFSTLIASVGTCTITTASPAVVSLTAHGLVEGDAIYFTTTGTLPTGLSADTTYYVKSTGNANTFQVSLTRTSSATAFTAGTAVNATVAGSGTHTVVKAPYGVPSSLNFYVPDFRGRTPVGIDNIGGTDAGLLSLTNALGGAGGVQTVTLDDTQIPTHVHGATGLTIGTTGSTHSHDAGNYDGGGINNYVVDNSSGPIAQYQGLVADGQAANNRIKATASADSAHTHNITGTTAGLAGAGQPHNNMQPFMLVNYIIKT